MRTTTHDTTRDDVPPDADQAARESEAALEEDDAVDCHLCPQAEDAELSTSAYGQTMSALW